MSRLFVAAGAAMFLAACDPGSGEPERAAASPPDIQSVGDYVGSEQCAGCHVSAWDAWQDSHHALAMQTATDDTVLADFSDVTVPYFDTRARFFRRGEQFVAELENESGELQTYSITDTFGVYPLQQYLVETENGRKQALQFSWDSRSKEDGGQRWYHLYPEEYVGPDHPFHWTGRYFTWNTMCAECHSTDLKVNFDWERRTFNTTFEEISVGCEACHGPGKTHIENARNGTVMNEPGFPVDLDDRGAGFWKMKSDTGIAALTSPGRQQQPESCGRCHSRRSVVTEAYEYGKHLMATHQPALLDEGLYESDGRILDEVYVYGSFLQSKMYNAGVTCSDCHEPHSARLRAGPDPNNTCALCHAPASFATVEHQPTQVGDCVACHMPAKTYMGVDDRRDHSFRLPDTQQDPGHYGQAIAAGRSGTEPDRVRSGAIDRSNPPIVRATLMTLLEQGAHQSNLAVLMEGLEDSSPLVRAAAVSALRDIPRAIRSTTGSGLLSDPVRAVRTEAAVTFGADRDLLDYPTAQALDAASSEYRQSLEDSLFWPESAVRLAEIESAAGKAERADALYRLALDLDDQQAAVHHAYGLFLIRQQSYDAALLSLERAWRLEPRLLCSCTPMALHSTRWVVQPRPSPFLRTADAPIRQTSTPPGRYPRF